MEVKHKEVVITKDIFVACDGTEFENEDDCIDYEFNIRSQKLACYNEDFKRVDLDSCDYVAAVDDELLGLFLEICDHKGYCSKGIDGVGLYKYIAECDYWLNISQIMTDFEAAMEEEKNEHHKP